jgi:hypothetical protein
MLMCRSLSYYLVPNLISKLFRRGAGELENLVITGHAIAAQLQS